MKKEPPQPPTQKQIQPLVQKTKPKEIEYHQSEKLSIKDLIITIPSEFKPNKIMSYSLVIIILLVILTGLAFAPWGAFTDFSSIEKNISIEIGFPWTFFKVELNNPEKLPLKIGNFLLDLLLYLIAAYLINIAINASIKSFKKTKKPKYTQLYNIQKTNFKNNIL